MGLHTITVTVIDMVDNLSLREPLCQKVEELRCSMQRKHELVNRSRLAHAESLLRQSVVWNLALYYLARSRFYELENLLRQLSDTDPDTACATLETLASPILSQGCVYEGSALFYDIMHHSVFAEVRAVAAEGYLYILDRTLSIQKREYSYKESDTPKSPLLPLMEWRPRKLTSGSREVNLDLRMRGFHLSAICRYDHVLPKEVEERLADWSRMLRLAGDERSVRLS